MGVIDRKIVDLEFTDGTIIYSTIIPDLSILNENISYNNPQRILYNSALPSDYIPKTRVWGIDFAEFTKISKNSNIEYYAVDSTNFYTGMILSGADTIDFMGIKRTYINGVAYVVAVVDEVNELGWIIEITSTNGTTFNSYAYGGKNSYYLAIHGNEPIIYNLQSVASLSGNLGTFNLVQTNPSDISDGLPRSEQPISVFTSLPDSVKVSTLVDNIIEKSNK